MLNKSDVFVEVDAYVDLCQPQVGGVVPSYSKSQLNIIIHQVNVQFFRGTLFELTVSS